jgi:hypothetical protein
MNVPAALYSTFPLVFAGFVAVFVAVNLIRR